MNVCKREDKGMEFARLYDSIWGEASEQQAIVHRSDRAVWVALCEQVQHLLQKVLQMALGHV